MTYSIIVWCFALNFSALAHRVHSQAVQQASPDQNVYSLASFDQNQATELTPACNDVYTALIPGCTIPDFLPTNACSAACINGLTNIQTEAQAACANNVAPPNSMLMFFTNGNGVEEMCTVQKALAPPGSAAAQTTLMTSVVPTTTVPYSPPSSTSTLSTAQLASQAGAGQTNTALSQGAIIGIVVAVVVAVALMAVVLSCLRWKRYSDD